MVTASIRAFATIMNERHGHKLLQTTMTAALDDGEPALPSLVTDLPADEDAVSNGLCIACSNKWSY